MNKSEKTYQIYTLEDPVTNEIRYVGFTSRSLPNRCSKHINECKKRNDYKSNWIKSILKKGLKPLIKHLDFCDKTNWQITEQYWISQFNSWGFKLTNATEGGEGNVGRKCSKETLINLQQSHSKQAKPITQYDLEFNKIKEFPSINEASRVTGCNEGSISRNCKKLNNHKINKLYYFRFKNDKNHLEIPQKLLIEFFGKNSMSEDGKKRMIEANKNKKLSKQQIEHLRKINTGKKNNEKTRKKISLNSTVKKRIVQLDLNYIIIKTWNSITEASQSLNISASSISACCRNYKSKTAKNFIWVYENEMELLIKKPIPLIKKKVQQIDIATNKIINIFESISLASKSTGISKISEVCTGNRKSAGGYKWEFFDEKLRPIIVPKIRKKTIRSSKLILQYDLNGNFLKEFSSVNEASSITGVGNDSVYVSCNTNNCRGGNYLWKFKENNNIPIKIKPYISDVKKIIQFSLKGEQLNIFNSIKEIHELLNINQRAIHHCCRTKLQNASAGGYMWRYFDVKLLNQIIKPYTGQSPLKQKRKVSQFSIDGNHIKNYDSIKIAFEETGVDHRDISKVCTGKSETAGGYIWKYA